MIAPLRAAACGVIAALTLGMALACGRSDVAPAPQPAALQISCPAPITIEQVTSGSQPVNYPQAATTGGSPPVTTACSPASGEAFPIGDTTVRCTATDGQGRQATCSFSVTLRHRGVSVKRILAFGDSMTEGENGRPGFVDLPNAYPTILQQLFDSRLPGQGITVVNEGFGGERVTENDARLKHEIGKYQPEVLLLLQGINDLAGGVSPSRVADALRDSIETARERGVGHVFVSTLLPTATENCVNQSGAPRCRGADIPLPRIVETNAMIRGLVPAAGAHLVDPFDEFMANRAAYVDIDGLHLRPEGNRALATAFLNRIVERLPAPALMGLNTSGR